MSLNRHIEEGIALIENGQWPRFREQGWRWERNLDVGPSLYQGNLAALLDCKRYYGSANVTLGNAWDATKLCPFPDSKRIGLYVRDVEQLVGKLCEDIDNWTVGSPSAMLEDGKENDAN